MAVIASLAVILVIGNLIMIVIRILLIMLVAENAFESDIVTWNNVTIGTIVPFLIVSARKNRKILAVVIPVGRPTAGSMAHFAICRETHGLMIGI